MGAIARESKDRRQQVLDAAVELFARDGYHAAGIREIAEAADCAVGTVYLHFSSKTDVCLALIDELYHRTMAEVVTRRDAAAEPVAKLHAALDGVVAALVGDRDLARVVLVKVAGSDPVVDGHLWRIHETFAGLVADELVECGVPRETAEIGAWAWVGSLAETFARWARDPHLDLVDMTDTVRALFWRGWGLA